MENSEKKNKNSKGLGIAIGLGLIMAAIKIMVATIQYKYYLEDYRTSSLLFYISLFTGLAVLPVAGFIYKRKFGANATLKDVFRTIFITILIGASLPYIYDQLWLNMDKTMVDRIYKGQTEFAKNLPNAKGRLLELKKTYDADKLSKPSFLNLTTQLLSYIIWYSILGFIFALMISRRKTT